MRQINLALTILYLLLKSRDLQGRLEDSINDLFSTKNLSSEFPVHFDSILRDVMIK